MTRLDAARGVGGLGALGVVSSAVDDFARGFVASPLVGPTPIVIAITSGALLLVGAILTWRASWTIGCVFGALVLQLLGRAAVGLHPAALYWAVTAAQLAAPVLTLTLAVVVVRQASGPAGRRLGVALTIAATCWLVASWGPVPVQVVPLARAVTDVLLVVLVAGPAMAWFARAVRGIWHSAAVP